MTQALDQLTAAVAQDSTVVDSAITLINGLAAQIQASIADPAALQLLVNGLNNKTQQLADAVAAGTAASTPPAPPAAPVEPPAPAA